MDEQQKTPLDWLDDIGKAEAVVRRALTELVRAAVMEEREACAKVAERVGTIRIPTKVDDVGPSIAAAIRARGQ